MNLAESLIQVVAPFDCLYCRKEGAVICLSCQDKLFVPQVSRCYRCRRATRHSATCADCLKRAPLKYVWVAGELNESTKRLLYSFKFERAQAACKAIAAMMAKSIPPINRYTIVVPAPTATVRVRRRGYDHARLLAKEIARLKTLSYEEHLVRLSQTRQVGAKREDRYRQMIGAFRVTRSQSLAGRHVLLVDDVLTTGATLEAAARTLKACGVLSVGAVVFAGQSLATITIPENRG